MVGVGPRGEISALARVTIINSFGNTVYDKFVSVPETVTDYRTKFSGIRRSDLRDAPDFSVIQKEVLERSTRLWYLMALSFFRSIRSSLSALSLAMG